MKTILVDSIYLDKNAALALVEDNNDDACFHDHGGNVGCVAFSGDGRYLASGSDDNTVKLYDMQTKTLLHNFHDHGDSVCCVAFSGDGRYLASGSDDNTVKLYDVQTKTLLHNFQDHGGLVLGVALSADGRYLASGSNDTTVKLYDVQTNTLLHSFEDHSETVYAVAFSGDGRYLASGSADNTVKLYDMQTKTLLHSFEDHSESVYAVAFSGDSRYLASGSGDKTVKLYDMQTKTLLHSFEDHSESVYAVAFSGDSRYLASGSVDTTVKLYDVQTKQCFHTFHGHSEWVEGVALSSNGYYLASASGDQTVNLLDIRKLILAHEISLGEISSRALVGQAGRQLRLEDKIRADLKPYHQKMLEDTNQGHWSLWDSQQDSEGKIKVHLAPKLVARNPACDIINGVVGIDFGTKSTVVACQKKSVKISPMRIGTGELGSSIEAHHYENPTIIAFNDLQRFICAYQQRAGRPFTQWRDITISHSANNALLNSSAKFFNAFLFELKQWAGNKNKKLKVVDQQGFVLDLPPFLELTDDDINPIEIYAYYLGLYINNMHNGIFLNYVLSFPVTYSNSSKE